MASRSLILAGICIVALFGSACSLTDTYYLTDAETLSVSDTPSVINSGISSGFMESGTIILSHQVPTRASQTPTQVAQESTTTPALMAPLIGYFPPAAGYIPADNEAWLEIDTASATLTVFKGKGAIKQLKAEGSVSIAPGEYFLRHKQKEPVWYAPDSYFHKRRLAAPAKGDSMRFRRGALGDFVLYPTPEFPIHCGPVWTDEVGGLRLSSDELGSIFYMLPVGASVVVR